MQAEADEEIEHRNEDDTACAVDRGVFKEIDAVGEQRNRADRQGDGELDPEIAEV